MFQQTLAKQGLLSKRILWICFLLAFLVIPLLAQTQAVQAEEAAIDATDIADATIDDIEQVQASSPLAPPNDQFGKATKITNLPFTANGDPTHASLQKNEPRASCSNNNPIFDKSIWYRYTATKNGSLLASLVDPYNTFSSVNSIAIYTGNGLAGLSEARCAIRYYYDTYLSFAAQAGTTYYFQVALVDGQAGPLSFGLQVTPPPQVSIDYFSSYGISIYDSVQFYANVSDPYGDGNITYAWSFGDGATSTDGYYAYHQYAKDGDYTVQLTVTTSDGRSASASRIIAVRTHDVAIVKFARPKTAAVGQTKRLVIGVSNKRYPEVVTMSIYKGSPNGNQFIGSWAQEVPVQANGTTDFYFRYTFTNADAALGKVTLIAVAELQNAYDALPADNTFITFPIIVTPAGVSAADATSEDDMSDYATDTVSNVHGADAQAGNKVFMPFVTKQ